MSSGGAAIGGAAVGRARTVDRLRAAARVPATTLFPPGRSARILDAALGILLVYRLPVPGLPAPVPQLAMIALIAIAVFRRPTRTFTAAPWYPAAMALLLAFLVIGSFVNGVSPERRATNIAVLMLFAAFAASGRIDIGAVVKGLGVGLVVSTAAFYLGWTPDEYAGKLTGFLEDKNAAALVYAAAAILLAATTHRLALRILVLLAGAAAMLATDSRTTMAAYGIAVLFLVASRWLRRGLQLLALIGGAALFFWADENLATFGGYALEREGSDAFRLRIDAASTLKTQAAPWYGSGLGEATVELDSGTWFFHNSYEALIVEGGVVLLVTMIALYVVVGLGLSPRVRIDARSFESRAITAATLVVFLCATRLGEVFFAPIGFVVLAVGLSRLLTPIAGAPPLR